MINNVCMLLCIYVVCMRQPKLTTSRCKLSSSSSLALVSWENNISWTRAKNISVQPLPKYFSPHSIYLLLYSFMEAAGQASLMYGQLFYHLLSIILATFWKYFHKQWKKKFGNSDSLCWGPDRPRL